MEGDAAMKPAIIAPVRSPDWVLPLIAHGAQELYTGVFYERWENAYGRYIEFNRRGSFGPKGNPTMNELEQMLALAVSKSVPVYLTVNALCLEEEQCDLLQPLIRRFAELGGCGVIFSDPILIDRIRQENLSAVVSSCAEVRNHYDARYWHRRGCERIILPRHLAVGEIGKICTRIPECEYEVFLMNSGCRMVDGFCRGTHHPELGGMCDFCAHAEKTDLDAFLQDSDEPCQKDTRRYDRILRHACGMCALYDLKDYASSYKIVGRVAEEQKILRDVETARTNLELALQVSSREEYLREMRRPEGQEPYCRRGLDCYYPEMRCFRG